MLFEEEIHTSEIGLKVNMITHHVAVKYKMLLSLILENLSTASSLERFITDMNLAGGDFKVAALLRTARLLFKHTVENMAITVEAINR